VSEVLCVLRGVACFACWCVAVYCYYLQSHRLREHAQGMRCVTLLCGARVRLACSAWHCVRWCCVCIAAQSIDRYIKGLIALRMEARQHIIALLVAILPLLVVVVDDLHAMCWRDHEGRSFVLLLGYVCYGLGCLLFTRHHCLCGWLVTACLWWSVSCTGLTKRKL